MSELLRRCKKWPFLSMLKGVYKVKKVITYGTFDLLHWGHIKLLERAEATW